MASCKCGNPPGGGGKCPNGHIAICRSDGSECEVSCIEPSDIMKEMIRNNLVLNKSDNATDELSAMLREAGMQSVGEMSYKAGRGRQIVASFEPVDGSGTMQITLPGLSPSKEK